MPTPLVTNQNPKRAQDELASCQHRLSQRNGAGAPPEVLRF